MLRHWSLVLAATGALAGGAWAQSPPPDLETIRKATARYQDLTAALADGYIHDPALMCVDAAMVGQPAERGAMGVHLFQPTLAGIPLPPPRGRLAGRDTILDWLHPEVLVYEPQADRSMVLVAVEYLVFAAPWDAGHRERPHFGTEPFVFTADDPATARDEGHMLEPHYELHLWIHRENPAGLFAQFNPRVTCGHYGTRPAAQAPDILRGIVTDALPAGTQVSTEELRDIVNSTSRSTVIVDVRRLEAFHQEHLPGAIGLEGPDHSPAERAGAAVRVVRRTVRMDPTTPIIVYGEGPLSPDPRLAAEALRAAGYTSVRRYQLGLAVWQALGGVTAIDAEGLAAAGKDREVVFVDAREVAERARDSLPGMISVPVPQIVRAVAEDRLPAEHTVRLITLGRDPAQARALAEQLVRQAYRRVAYFDGTWETARRLLTGSPAR